MTFPWLTRKAPNSACLTKHGVVPGHNSEPPCLQCILTSWSTFTRNTMVLLSFFLDFGSSLCGLELCVCVCVCLCPEFFGASFPLTHSFWQTVLQSLSVATPTVSVETSISVVSMCSLFLPPPLLFLSLSLPPNHALFLAYPSSWPCACVFFLFGRSVFFRCFSLVFFFKSMWVGSKKTQSAEKNTRLEHTYIMLSPTLTLFLFSFFRPWHYFLALTFGQYILFDLDKHERAHITPTVLDTPHFPTQVSKIWYTHFKGSIHSFLLYFYVRNQPSSACVSGFHFSQKSMQSWSHYNVCVFVFLPNEQINAGG